MATNDQKLADVAAQAFGAKAAYGNAKDLIRDLEIDLVTIAVKVPDHRELVLDALAAGKHIYFWSPPARLDAYSAREPTPAPSLSGRE